MIQKWPYLLAIAILVATTFFIEISYSPAEELVPNKPFSEFPLVLADRWEGREVGLKEEIEKALELSDYMMRRYVPAAGQVGEEAGLKASEGNQSMREKRALPVWLYVGFYQSQRTGSTYHLPKNCLPGAGWTIMQSEYVTLPMPGDQSVTINQVLVQKGLDKQVILYWYHERGRVIASEYWAKGYLVWDSMTKHRSDGSLVRISVPVQDGTEEEAFDHAVQFLQDMWPVLLDFMPDQTII
jgi:EpsI family protein